MDTGALQFRKFDFADIDAVGRLLVDSYPHRGHEVEFWRRDDPRERPARWVACRSATQEVVAYAALWTVEPFKCRFDVIVEAAWQRAAIGSHLFAIVLAAAEEVGAGTIQARAYAGCAEAIAFLERRHFVETMRMHGYTVWLRGELLRGSAGAAAAPASLIAPAPTFAVRYA